MEDKREDQCLGFITLTNRITTAGFEYDANGNQTRALAPDGQSWYRYEYDDANRLIYIKQDNGTLIQTQEFSIGNDRISVTDAASNLKTYYQGSAVEYTESNGSGVLSWTKSYVYLGDSLLSTTTASGVEYAHPDALGTRLVSNAQTGATSENVNLPFGTQITNESTNTTNKRKFTSYDRSAVTGLDYAQNRTYDPKQGRFTQVDPIGMSASSLLNPQSLNLYAYCGNDPINHTDPTGLFWGKLFRVIVKVVLYTIAVLVAGAALLANSLGHPWLAVELLVASANIFAIASGNKTFQKITKYLSIAISAYQIYNSPPSIIVSFTSAGGTNSHSLPFLFASVGAITSNFAQQTGDKKRKRRKTFVRGGLFPPELQTPVNDVKDRVGDLLKNPDCARVLGGVKRAQALLNKATVLNGNTINPKYQGSDGTYPTAASDAYRQANNPRSNNVAVSEYGGSIIYLNNRFFSVLDSSKQETVFIHEIHRLGGYTGDDIPDYANITQACGTRDPLKRY